MSNKAFARFWSPIWLQYKAFLSNTAKQYRQYAERVTQKNNAAMHQKLSQPVELGSTTGESGRRSK